MFCFFDFDFDYKNKISTGAEQKKRIHIVILMLRETGGRKRKTRLLNVDAYISTTTPSINL
jgi:hypothetical protein